MRITNRWPMACGIVLVLPACVLPQTTPLAGTLLRSTVQGDVQAV